MCCKTFHLEYMCLDPSKYMWLDSTLVFLPVRVKPFFASLDNLQVQNVTDITYILHTVHTISNSTYG